MVTGVPRLDARSTASLSGMMPSSGTDRISSTSSMGSISPRAARAESKRVISRCFSMRSPFSTFTVLESSRPMMRSESRIDDDDRGIGKPHGERGAALDAGGAVADHPIEHTAQLRNHATDPFFGQRVLVAGLRRRQQEQCFDALVPD